MIVEIRIPVRPPSQNHGKRPCMVGGKMRLVKVKNNKAHEISETIKKVLLYKYQRLLGEFAQTFDRKVHFIEAEFFWIYKREEYWTKDQCLNLNVPDTTNPLKPVEDLVFKFMGLNDGYVKRISLWSVPGNQEEVVVKLTLRDLEMLKEF